MQLKEHNSEFFAAVYKAVKKIPKGRVATYGDIAWAIGKPKAARAVGQVLHVNPQPVVIPCHRVVNRLGKLAKGFGFGGMIKQKELLQADGVEVVDNTVDLKKYRFLERWFLNDAH